VRHEQGFGHQQSRGQQSQDPHGRQGIRSGGCDRASAGRVSDRNSPGIPTRRTSTFRPMKRWLVTLLAPALILGLAPAQAATPGIRSTREYQQLRTYVQELDAKKNQPQTAAEIQRYRSELSQRRAKAAGKVRALYQDQLSKAKQRRDNRKAKVQRLKQRKRQSLADLRQAEQARLNAIAADRRAALARINGRASARLDTLGKQRAKLQRRIARATNPVTRQNLREQLQAVQDQINTVTESKQDDIRIANNKYDDQADQAKESYAERIERATEQADRAIQNLRQRLRELYGSAKQNAQQRRAGEFSDVKALYDRGVGYIDQMSQN
jgi:DNA repair exonuclease SbcCD ATPase subunit